MGANTQLAGLLEVLRKLIYDLTPTGRDRFVIFMSRIVAMTRRFPSYERALWAAARTELSRGADGHDLLLTLDLFLTLARDEQERILEIARQEGEPRALEDALIAWARARRVDVSRPT